jgi:spore maturation protein B
MKLLMYLSDACIPILLLVIVVYGLLHHTAVYESFVNGAKDGFATVIGILPTLVGLMCAVGVLRASGFLEDISGIVKTVIPEQIYPSELIPVAIIKMFSSSAATGLVLDIFKEYGPDSLYGKIVSIMGSCTETIFYTMSVYFMSVKVQKTRWTLPGALLCTLAGLAASVCLGRMI